MTAECWRWRPRWNQLASSASCFGSSACLQSSSSVTPEHRSAIQCNVLQYCNTPVSDIPSRRQLQSATWHHLTETRYWLSSFGRRAFSVASLTVWNLLPDSLRDPALSSNSFRQSLKMNLFRRYHSAHTAQLRCFMTLRYINPLLTLTLTADGYHLQNTCFSNPKIIQGQNRKQATWQSI